MFELTINRSFNVSVETLFKAWSDPKIIQKWFAPGNMSVPSANADVRVGGKYQIVMHDKDENSDHIIGGEYKKVVKNELLAFTWQWQGNPVATYVQIDFKKITANSAELKLTHQEFISQEDADKHEMGWNGCLANLTKAF